jgi:hypothetical protein
MDGTTSAPNVWSLNGNVAQLAYGKLAGRVDVSRPDAGLRSTALDDGYTPCLLFCTRRANKSTSTSNSGQGCPSKVWPLTVADAYIRGNDLVASYGSNDEWPYSPQIYWQARTLESIQGTLASLSLLVSVQTHLLDTHPRIEVASQVPSGDTLFITIGENGVAGIEPVKQDATIVPHGAMCCVLWRLPAAPASYVEVVSTSDVRAVEFVPGPRGGWLARWQLFAEFLEKGVIRRARVHGVLVPRENDTEMALECCRAAEQCPLPLTT